MSCLVIDCNGSKANEICVSQTINASEATAISEIVKSCDNDNQNDFLRKRTVGFGDYVCLKSYLHLNTARKYLKVVKNAKYVFVHNNAGGVSTTGAKIGDDIFDHKRTLIISGYCASACADYLFPAAEKVIFIGPFSKGSFLAWHGSPDSDGLRANVTPENHKKALEAHHDFLQRFTPAHREQLSRLMDISRDGLSISEERKQKKTWTYTDDELCHTFGFDNLYRLLTR